jgi:uncharacterized protein YjeT (DUF2065 family)
MNVVTQRLLIAAASIEVVTGLTLVVAPALFVRLLLSEEILGAGLAVSRVAGFALIALGVACWPGLSLAHEKIHPTQPLLGMLIYNVLATTYLFGVGLTSFSASQAVGWLLWPGVALHGVFTLLFIREWFRH